MLRKSFSSLSLYVTETCFLCVVWCLGAVGVVLSSGLTLEPPPRWGLFPCLQDLSVGVFCVCLHRVLPIWVLSVWVTLGLDLTYHFRNLSVITENMAFNATVVSPGPVLISTCTSVRLQNCSARLLRTSWGQRNSPHAAVGVGRAELETCWQPPPFVPDTFAIGLCQRLRDPVVVEFRGVSRHKGTAVGPLHSDLKISAKMEGSLPSPSLEPGVSSLITPRAPPLLGKPRVAAVTATPPCICQSSPGKQHHLPA